MKTIISISFALLAAAAAHAQVLRPAAVNGALLGGVAGAVIGHNSGDLRHNAWKGAAIGAGAGLLMGDAVGRRNDPRADSYAAHGGYVQRHSPVVYAGYRGGYPGYGRHGHGSRHGGYIGYGYGSGYSPGYYPGYGAGYPYYNTGYGSYAADGLFWGGLAGAIIGNNSGDFRHNAWRGAAWGAGVGWLLGAVADSNRRVYTQAPVTVQPAPTQVQPAAQAPQPVTIINNYYNAPATPMSAANGMFGRN